MGDLEEGVRGSGVKKVELKKVEELFVRQERQIGKKDRMLEEREGI